MQRFARSKLLRVRSARSGAALLVLAAALQADARTPIWIDTDPAIDAPYREVDDAFALVLAFHSPDVQIAGISTTFGNAGVERTTTVARDLARRFGADAGIDDRDVFLGAPSRQSSGIPTAATAALSRALARERLTYVALGPLTNLATCLKIHPELALRIDRVIFVGGRTAGRPLKFGALQIHDANVLKDPASVQVLFDTRIPIVLAPAEAGGRLVLTREAANELASDGPAAAFLQRNSRFWLWFWTIVVKNPGGPLFDSLAIIAATTPADVPAEPRYARIDAGELILTQTPDRGARQVRVCTDIGSSTTKLMIRRLLSRAKEKPTARR